MVEMPGSFQHELESGILEVFSPQSTMINESHVEGANFFRIKFEGTSNRIYGIKKMKRAML